MIQLTVANYRNEVEQALTQLLRLACLQRPTVADLPALAALDTSLFADQALVYVASEGRVYQLTLISGAAVVSPDVVAPTAPTTRYPRARWLRVTSSATYGPNANAPLHSRSTGTLREVRLYAGEGGAQAQLTACMGAMPSLMIDQDGEQVQPLSAGYPGSLYRVAMDFALMVFTSNLQGAPEAIADPAVIIGQVRKVVAGIDGSALGLEGVDRIEIGAASLVEENEQERRFVYSAPVTVTCYVTNPDEDLTPFAIDAQPELVSPPPLDRNNCVVQGIYVAVPDPPGLTATLAAGVARVSGTTVAVGAVTRAWAPGDTYVDLAADGTLTYSTGPQADGTLRVGSVVANFSGVTEWRQLCGVIQTFRSAYQIAP